MSVPVVLVVWSSHIRDAAIARVTAALQQRGCRVVALDSAKMPLGCDLSLSPDGGVLQTEGLRVDLATVDAVWLRHTHVAAGIWHLLDPHYAVPIRDQTTTHLWDVLGCVPHARVVDPLHRLRSVPGPVGMLRLARAAGLAIPRTLVSNDPTEVAQFLDSVGGACIKKMLDSSASKVPRPDGEDYLPTLRVTPADRAQLDRVALCPMVFQEEVEKDVELRVTVVGDRLFTGAVRPGNTVDWRQHPELVGAFQPWSLDPSVAESIGRLMDMLGLETGTVDIIVRPNGEHVFLEVNTISFFDFLEDATHLPISEAVADLLAGASPGRLAVANT